MIKIKIEYKKNNLNREIDLKNRNIFILNN